MKVKPIATTSKVGLNGLTGSKSYKVLKECDKHGLTTNYYLSLLYIYYNAGCRYADISNHYGWSKAYMFKVVRLLAHDGYVDLKFLPNKFSYVTLLDKGVNVCKSLLSIK